MTSICWGAIPDRISPAGLAAMQPATGWDEWRETGHNTRTSPVAMLMKPWLTTRLRLNGSARILALLLTVIVSGLPHSADPNHDAEWSAGALVAHDASAHRLTAPGPGADHEIHCLACHAGRFSRVLSP